MALAIPLRTVDNNKLAAVRAALRQHLVELVQQSTQLSADQIRVRDLVANDFSGGTFGSNHSVPNVPTFSNQVLGLAAGSADYVDALTTAYKLDSDQAFAIWGLQNLTAVPTLRCIRLMLGPTELRDQIAIEYGYSAFDSGVIFDPVSFYGPRQIMQIKFLFDSATAVGAENMVLLGSVAEPAGNTVA